ncbi:MAG: citrate (Si)-synthase [Candidatus Sericytochromatia bacterium]
MAESEVLFTITKDQLETGLRGVPVGYCPTSSVDPQLGLFYGGYPVEKLAYNEPEEVIYLLFNRELPNAEQLAEFKKVLVAHSKLNPEIINHLKALPKEGHPMKWFMHGLNLMGMYSGTGDYKKDAMNVVAQLPELVAAIYRIRSGWGETIESKPELGYIENFVHMLNPPNTNDHLLELMKVFNVLHFDHGGGNLSTFVGKAIASGQEDMYGSLMGAMSALAGPLHGMANQECLRFLKTALENVSDPTDENAVNDYINKLFAEGKKLYGFGHAVLRVEDPRATVQYALGEKICPDNKIFRMAVSMRKLGTEFLKKQEKVSNPYPNVDAVSGSLLTSVGLTDENYYTVLFGMSRCVGIAAQIIYERLEARGGKGTPIIRPKYVYSGPKR